MASQAIENPLPMFTGLNGLPLDAGYIYFGEPEQDPRTYPVQVYWDEAQTIPAQQPLRTSAGYLWRNGAPATVWLDGNYSTLVLDRKGRQVFYAPNWTAASATNIAYQLEGPNTVIRSVTDVLDDFVSVKDFDGVVGDGSHDDTAGIQRALNSGRSLLWPSGIYRASNLVGATNEQAFIAVGNVRIKKNDSGPILTHSGRDLSFTGIVLDGLGGTYTGHNLVMTGDGPQLINCGSRDAAGRAVKSSGNALCIWGTNQAYFTADTTTNGYDIEVGVSGTNTLDHELHGVRTNQSTGGILFVDTGNHTIVGGKFGKLNISRGTGPAGVNGGKTIGARITGNVFVDSSNAVFSSNVFAAIAINIGTVYNLTSGVSMDSSNFYQVGCTITNVGNANNFIERNTSSGSYPTIQYGGDAGLGSMSFLANTGQLRWKGGDFVLGTNNRGLKIRNGANTSDLRVADIDGSDNLFLGAGVPSGAQSYLLGGTAINFAVNGATRFLVDQYSLLPNNDNTYSVGSGPRRPTEYFAVSGTINTSDEREKQDIESIPDAWLDAWGAIEWSRYKWKDAVLKKGDGARWHLGNIAQRVRDVFLGAGIDPFAIGLLCYDEWENIEAADGVVIPAGNRFGLRYEEALVLEAAWQRRELSRMKERIAALEAA